MLFHPNGTPLIVPKRHLGDRRGKLSGFDTRFSSSGQQVWLGSHFLGRIRARFRDIGPQVRPTVQTNASGPDLTGFKPSRRKCEYFLHAPLGLTIEHVVQRNL